MEPPADMPQYAAPSENTAASNTAATDAAQTTDSAASAEADATDTVSTKGLKAGTALTILGGSFTLDFARYELLPKQLEEKVIAEAGKQAE